jgi:hypothetical protein
MTGGFRERRLRCCLVRIALFMASLSVSPHNAFAQPRTLNLSQDLVSLGIASSNMIPNQQTLAQELRGLAVLFRTARAH